MIPKKGFKRVGNTYVFTGMTLDVYIPTRFEAHGCLEINETLSTLGIFDMDIDGAPSGLLLGAIIEMAPSSISTIMRDNKRFVKASFVNGDIFMTHDEVMQDQRLAYVIFYELMYGGHVPRFLKYDDDAFVFDKVSELINVNFRTDHVIFEMMTALTHRDKNNLNLQYRHTDMKTKPTRIPYRQIVQIAASTTSRIAGSYMDDGIDVSLINAAETNSEGEDLLRN